MAIASTAAAVAAANSAQAAAAARRAECAVTVKGYQHDKATVAEMRQYADCIDALHPDPIQLGIGTLVVCSVLLAGIVVGAVHEFLCGFGSDSVFARLGFGAFKGFVGGGALLIVGGLALLAWGAYQGVMA
jgi:hypothetical protein